MKYSVNIIYYRSHWWYVRDKIIIGLNNSVFVYEDDYNWGVRCCHWKSRKLIKEIDGGFGWQLGGWGCYLICFFVDFVW